MMLLLLLQLLLLLLLQLLLLLKLLLPAAEGGKIIFPPTLLLLLLDLLLERKVPRIKRSAGVNQLVLQAQWVQARCSIGLRRKLCPGAITFRENHFLMVVALPFQEAKDFTFASIDFALNVLPGFFAEPVPGKDRKVVRNKLASVDMVLKTSQPVRGVRRGPILGLVDPRHFLLDQLNWGVAPSPVQLRVARVGESNRGLFHCFPESSPEQRGVTGSQRLPQGGRYSIKAEIHVSFRLLLE
jgi:hypothetical protein